MDFQPASQDQTGEDDSVFSFEQTPPAAAESVPYDEILRYESEQKLERIDEDWKLREKIHPPGAHFLITIAESKVIPPQVVFHVFLSEPWRPPPPSTATKQFNHPIHLHATSPPYSFTLLPLH
jgi:hypothetical protein